MKAKISFLVSGHIVQTIVITKLNYTPQQLIKDLKNGIVATTVQEDESVIFVENSEIVGYVENVDNNLEYFDFELEEE